MIKIILEIEFYLLFGNIEKLKHEIAKKFNYFFHIKPEVNKNQYEIISGVLTFNQAICFIKDLQKILFFMDSVYSFPFKNAKTSPNGLHINFINSTFSNANYVYSLADFLCHKIRKCNLKNILRVGNLSFFKCNNSNYKDVIEKLAAKRYFSNCIYIPRVLSFSHRFNRTTAIRLIKDYGQEFRLEFRLGHLYCDFPYLLSTLYDFINKFIYVKTNCMTNFKYLTYSSNYKEQIKF